MLSQDELMQENIFFILRYRIKQLIIKCTKMEVLVPLVAVWVVTGYAFTDKKIIELWTNINWLLMFMSIPGGYILRGFLKAKTELAKNGNGGN